MEYVINFIWFKMGKNYVWIGENVSMMEVNFNNEDEEESWIFVGDLDMVEDLSFEVFMKMVVDLRDF